MKLAIFSCHHPVQLRVRRVETLGNRLTPAAARHDNRQFELVLAGQW
jgi:hypothetical protein